MTTSTSSPLWAEAGLKPHVTKGFKVSNDPMFEEKVTDIVGLYLDPPDLLAGHKRAFRPNPRHPDLPTKPPQCSARGAADWLVAVTEPDDSKLHVVCWK